MRSRPDESPAYFGTGPGGAPSFGLTVPRWGGAAGLGVEPRQFHQEPIDQPYGARDAAVRDPSGNHLRLSQPLAR